MKKLIILIFSLLIVGCTPASIGVTTCTKTLDEPITIEREINLHHKDNLITKVESIENFYFSEEFTEEMFERLKTEMLERHKDSKNLTFETEVENDYATMHITLKDLDKAETSELMLMGMVEDDADYLPGIKETVRLNEKEGYICISEED